ncbi:MAG: hypothetical protein WKF41_04180 [Gaiellaceae bacterium]
MGQLDFTVHASVGGVDNDVKIRVDAPLDRFGLPGLTLRSSSVKAPNIEGTRWPPELAWAITDRLAGAGARKGRILAVWQSGQVVAACVWHVHERGPLTIFDLGCRNDVKKDADRMRTALLACLRDIAEVPELHRTTDQLYWTDLPLDRMPDKEQRKQAKHEVRQRAASLKFGPLSPRPRWLKGEWAAVRRFS